MTKTPREKARTFCCLILRLGDSSSRTRSGGQAPGGRLRSFLPALIGVRGDEADDRAVCLERGLTPALPAFVSLRQTQAPPVLDHTGALPQRDRRVGPALDRCSVGGHRQGVVLDAGQVIDDGLAVRSVHVSMRNVKCVRVPIGLRCLRSWSVIAAP